MEKPRAATGRSSLDPTIRELIRTMSRTNPLWGAPRIHGELLKLDIQVSQANVSKYMIRPPQAPITIVADISQQSPP